MVDWPRSVLRHDHNLITACVSCQINQLFPWARSTLLSVTLGRSPFPLSPSVCLSVSPCLSHLPWVVSFTFCRSLSWCLSVSLSGCLSLYCPPVCLFLGVCLFSLPLSVSLCGLSVCLSVCLSLHTGLPSLSQPSQRPPQTARTAFHAAGQVAVIACFAPGRPVAVVQSAGGHVRARPRKHAPRWGREMCRRQDRLSTWPPWSSRSGTQVQNNSSRPSGHA